MKNFNKKTLVAVLAIVVILVVIAIAGKNSSMKSVANNFDLSLDKKSDEPLTYTMAVMKMYLKIHWIL